MYLTLLHSILQASVLCNTSVDVDANKRNKPLLITVKVICSGLCFHSGLCFYSIGLDRFYA